MITISIVSGLAGTILSVYIFRGMDKVRGFKLAMLLEAILLALLYFFSQSSLIIIFAFIIAINFIQLAATPLQWAMLSDVVDAIERDTGKKMSGIVFSTNLFAIKLGIAIGGALMGWLLSWSGYIGGVAQQPQAAILTIKLIFTILPAVLVLALVLIMRRYSLSDRSLAMVEKTSTL
jgi:Na+/melibiose symporter-like transporter